ncbi:MULTISPECIES: hypothetical protein [unclassified Nocardiopsis]|uniref:hypothetical protein n=1 Tax=Nocardiopsis TaxID=2013 RepID=UPI00387A9C13
MNPQALTTILNVAATEDTPVETIRVFYTPPETLDDGTTWGDHYQAVITAPTMHRILTVLVAADGTHLGTSIDQCPTRPDAWERMVADTLRSAARDATEIDPHTPDTGQAWADNAATLTEEAEAANRLANTPPARHTWWPNTVTYLRRQRATHTLTLAAAARTHLGAAR